MNWTWSKPLLVIGAVLSVALGGVSSMKKQRSPERSPEPIPWVISQRGRDREVFRLIQSAKRTITIRTESLRMVPLVNELCQAQQNGKQVSVFLPLEDGQADARLGNSLIGLGAVVQWKEDLTASNYLGAYVEVDGERFLYSAAPLTPTTPGANIGYVSGAIMR